MMEYSRIPKKPSIKLQLGFWFLMFILIFVSGIFFIFIAIELFSSGYVVMLMVLASIGFDIIIISFLGEKIWFRNGFGKTDLLNLANSPKDRLLAILLIEFNIQKGH